MYIFCKCKQLEVECILRHSFWRKSSHVFDGCGERRTENTNAIKRSHRLKRGLKNGVEKTRAKVSLLRKQ